MTRHMLLNAALAFICFFICLAGPVHVQKAAAASQVQTRVRVIHASGGTHHIDEGLKDLAAELESVFRYTAYSLIQSRGMTLGYNQKGQVSLPGGRLLIVSPTRIDGQRIQYHISILKENKQMFQTTILLKNRSSLTIGGPRHQDGYLLFNISGHIR